jgi:CRP-like cAMP-binding protein
MEHLLHIFKENHFSENDIQLIQGIATPANVKTYKTMVDYGEKCQSIYFVLKGGFVLKILNEADGNERTINFHLASFNPFMTVPHSYFKNEPSHFKLQAITNSDVLVFNKTALIDATHQSEKIKDFYYQQIIDALILELDFRTKLISLSPKKIYELLISDYQEVIRNVSSKDIANFMGISPEWLSNLKQKM